LNHKEFGTVKYPRSDIWTELFEAFLRRARETEPEEFYCAEFIFPNVAARNLPGLLFAALTENGIIKILKRNS